MYTYQQAYSKIIDAYFMDEIKIQNARFCFCGTLAPDYSWQFEYSVKTGKYPYTHKEYARMEQALFSTFPEITLTSVGNTKGPASEIEIINYEEKLFAGMSAALDELKKIHEERGEIIDELPVFKKRQLVTN